MKDNENKLTPEQMKNMPAVPWVAYDALQEQCAKERKWHIIKDIIKDVIILGIVIAFLCFLGQYEIENCSLSADGNSNANYVGGNFEGDINNGGTSDSTENETQKSVAEKGEDYQDKENAIECQEENSLK